jgi:phage shock protein PspC (stress-responsive transcriptional regulator)
MTIVQKRLTRLPAAGRIAGICAGLAEYFDVDVTLVRLAWVILSIVPGGIIGGVIAYLIAWAIVPPATGTEQPATARRLFRSATDVRIAGVCAGIAEYFDVDPTIVRLLWALLTLVPGAIVLGVFAYGIAWLVMPQATSTPPPLEPMPSSAT